MEKKLAAVAAELVARTEPGWDHLTLRATSDSGFTSRRVTSGPSENDVRVRQLESLVALGADGPVVFEMRVEPDGAFTALLTEGIQQQDSLLPPTYSLVFEPRPRQLIPPYERTEVTSTGPLAAVEAELGVPLPGEVHELYLSGVTEFGDHTLLPADEILTVRRERLEDEESFFSHSCDHWAEPVPYTGPLDAVQLVGFHPLWVPIVRYPSGVTLCVDLAPGPRGRVGQVITASLNCYPLELLAESVTEWHRSPVHPERPGMRAHYSAEDYDIDVVAEVSQRFQTLRELGLHDLGDADLGPLASLTDLRELTVSGGRLRLGGLAGLPLERLHVTATETDIPVLERLTSLTVSGARVELPELPKLRVLDVSGAEVDVESLPQVDHLTLNAEQWRRCAVRPAAATLTGERSLAQALDWAGSLGVVLPRRVVSGRP
ncbi:SMI1/KNR4 family protein [Lentzea aerocolonigenes]|uniref:SMI1/KNR4 family protein n=1 Tax=Lentzea aerocolonigenes TaxID=68170 RepID=UPI0004C31107|nr:SMI1/KNR4 family protein [Lentzea aerocolonigenes]MCP2250718.1 Cell wall assembly regulator SMI1 [Lentzea aerocolonigenes]